MRELNSIAAKASLALQPQVPPAVVSAAASSDDVEEELQGLVSEMTKLQLGLKKACVTFARSLADEGVMSLQRLGPLPLAKAHALLQKAGMKDLQVDAVLQAFSAQAQEEAAAAQKKVQTLQHQQILSAFAGVTIC